MPDEKNKIPCQLSIRLFDLSHPDSGDEGLWSHRPLIYEDFIEIENFSLGGVSNYDQLIDAMEEGFNGLLKETLVREYRKLVNDQKNEVFYSKLYDLIGIERDISESNDSYEWAKKVMFSEMNIPLENAVPESGGRRHVEKIP